MRSGPFRIASSPNGDVPAAGVDTSAPGAASTVSDRATYRLVVEYDGTEFAGFQWQDRLRTVQGDLEAALAALFGERCAIAAAGRTDAGVHASGQVISFLAHDRFPIEKLAIAMNSRLAADVTVRDAARMPAGFSARFHALERRYRYVVLNRRAPSAVLRRFTHFDYRALDLERMRAAAERIAGERDFASFCATVPARGGTVRHLRRLAIERDGDLIIFHYHANGFLHRMVRIATGTLLAAGAGLLGPDDVTRMLDARDRRVAGPTAPACGLTLTEVLYENFSSAQPEPGSEPG